MFKSSFSVLIVLLVNFVTFSQVTLSPINQEVRERITNRTFQNKTNATYSDTLNLPFFDDFYASKGRLDSSKWVDKGGVYVNNRFCVDPPNYNVATFDGMNRFGNPYEFGSAFATGVADTLTSQPINLEGLTASDSLYLSFYVQAGGIGELPDTLSDSLWVEFKNFDNEWITVWSKRGTYSRDFFKASIPVLSNEFYFKGFQFRILSAGNLSGAFDIWNVDYIYLNSNRRKDDLALVDVSFSRTPTRFLKRFTNMPYWQFFANPTNEVMDSSKTSINNLDKNAAIVTNKAELIDLISGQVIENYTGNSGFIMQANRRQLEVKTQISANSLVNSDSTQRIGIKYYLTTQDQNTTFLPLKVNDTLVSVTELRDYVSYDDGSAEFGFGVNQRYAKIAQKYVLNVPDTLKSLLIHFAKAGYNYSSQTITLRVWESISDTKDSILWNRSVKVNYSDTMNGFFRYDINPPILVDTSFYVGWRQLDNNVINVGFDVHNNANDKIFYTLNNQWFPLQDFTGSIMIRPEMYRTKLLGLKDETLTETSSNKLIVYPNPASENITIVVLKQELVEIYSITGQKVKSEICKAGTSEINVENLKAGMYFVKTASQTTKLIIE